MARAGDFDRALAASFAPRAARPDLLALCAFNVELARIAEQVSEAELGAIRLQWWREAMSRSLNGETVGHPVADAFGATMRARALPQATVTALIDARQFDVADKIMPDWISLETYLKDTAGAMFALGGACLGARDRELAEAAARAGLAYGLTGLMRALPAHAAGGLVYLPADMLVAHGTGPEAVLAGASSPGLRTLLAALRQKAHEACAEAGRRVAGLDRAARAAFLPLRLVDPYLAALEALDRSGADPLRQVADINPLYRFWRMAGFRQ
ncbi:MAG TPA: squalene/phytoene synthase family protein [Methyloceanibacter sp.]|nr:squalene/phytoene synthase family protein [Methyloceanibacter sp.]